MIDSGEPVGTPVLLLFLHTASIANVLHGNILPDILQSRNAELLHVLLATCSVSLYQL